MENPALNIIDSIYLRDDLIEVKYQNKITWENETVLFRKEEFEHWLLKLRPVDFRNYWDDLEPHDWNKAYSDENVYQDLVAYFDYKLHHENFDKTAEMMQNAMHMVNATRNDPQTVTSLPSSEKELLDLLIKAVATIEEVYEKDFELLHEDNAYDYKDMITVLNQYGYDYEGKEKILALTQAPDFWQMKDHKKPMKRATGRKKEAPREENRKQQGRKLG